MPLPLADAALAVILNIKTFGAVRLYQRVCRHCGHDFEPVRTTS